MPPNPYLSGNYAPVHREETLTTLEVTGTLPAHLDGRYVRNGPNPVGEVAPAAYHWFVGDGMVHGVRLRAGRAEWYRSRWVRSKAAAADLHEPTPALITSAGGTGLGANTNVIGHAGKTLALIEGGIASYELTDELDTIGICDFAGTLTAGYTAHPKRDPVSGELHAVSYDFGRRRSVQYSVIDAGGRARRTVDIAVTGSPMMHDIGLTENYVIFLDLPVVFDPGRAVRGTRIPGWLSRPTQLVVSALVGRVTVPNPVVAMSLDEVRNADLAYSWDPCYPARIGVMPRDGGPDVRWFDVDPCYVFHTMGAYEVPDPAGTGPGTIVLDVVRHPRMFVTDPHGPGEGSPRLTRWELDLATARVGETTLEDRGQEFPRTDERRLGRPYRFGYSIGLAAGSGAEAGDELVRHDLVAGTTTRRSLGAGAQGGEFVFVPNGDDAAEDDGVLMGFVYDPASERSRLALLDSATLDTVAEVHLPIRVPHGFHGNWLPTAG